MITLTESMDVTKLLSDYVDNFSIITIENGDRTKQPATMESILNSLIYNLGEEFNRLGIVVNDCRGNAIDLTEASVDASNFRHYCEIPGTVEGCECEACRVHNECC